MTQPRTVSEAIALRDASRPPQLTEEQVELVKRTIAKGSTNDELALFIQQCNRTGLDPFARQIYSIKRSGERQTQVSIDGARLVAERTRRYRPGHTYYYDGDGTETPVWLKDTPPAAARVTVYKDGFEVPGIPVRFSERVQNTPTWKTMPATMLAKCAEMATLRQAFPHDLAGLYSTDEIAVHNQAGFPPAPTGDIPFEESEPEPEAGRTDGSALSAPVSTARAEQSSGSAEPGSVPQRTPEGELSSSLSPEEEAASPETASSSPDPIVVQAGEMVVDNPKSKMHGRTVADLAEHDPRWCLWYLKNGLTEDLKAAISTFMWYLRPDLMADA